MPRLLSGLALLLSLGLLAVCKPPAVPLQPAAPAPPDGTYRSLATGGQGLRVYADGRYLLEGVPFVLQGPDNTCGQAVATMLCRFWGLPADYQALVRRSNPFNLATSADALVNLLRAAGLQAQAYRAAAVDNLVAEIGKGHPVPVLLDFGGLAREHYVLVVGFNRADGSLIVHDSRSGPYCAIDGATFVQRWNNASLALLPDAGNYRRLMLQVMP